MNNLKRNILSPIIILLIACIPAIGFAQIEIQNSEDLPSPRGAFLRSLVVPGWGHYYAEKDNWNRGKYHLATEAALVLTYFGLNARSNYLENDYETFALSHSGSNIGNKNRQYRIAIGNFDNLRDYNDAQLQTRNWNQRYPETAEYNWNWDSREHRIQYQNAREKVDQHRSQLPSLVALMVANRLISGVSAFIHARNRNQNIPEVSFSYLNEFGERGLTARVSFSLN